MSEQFFVYILANGKHGTLYVGVTNDVTRRVHQHKAKVVKGFTTRYGVDKPVYFEIFDDPLNAIAREKQLKKWNREWKLQLIENNDPGWIDLSHSL